MDLSKKKRYDELIEEAEYVYNELPIIMDADKGVMAAILVASQHSREDLSYSCEAIGDESKTKVIGQKMKEYRLSHGLSQKQLAKQLGISRPYMSEIESNKRSMSIKTINNFTDKLGITLSDFFN
ncbi:helix-turn-helix domain-containing protein [Companilactobacillus alimentarius]|uniref:helix-turn-helix domain-containing protein n=1 Tax=Companilactobacillus alimentarius TaxID=1602 RepID=UPI0028B84813|nr:helix-turn-helix domain-containing protein [Companilactobacillus alimentarius]MDT6951853.1 helix-turn-helix domain-containing protein [Companilactobacillus alimentarius]